MTTTDLSKFGFREIKMASELLNEWVNNGLPKDFECDEVTIMMNRNSGYVFLTNSDFQVAMMYNNKLELFYSCPECGCESFKDDIENNGNECCQEYLKAFE